MLWSITDKNHYSTIKNLFFNTSKNTTNPKKHPELVIVKNLTDEGYVGQSNLCTKYSSEEINNYNNTNYYTGLLKDEFLYYHKLDDLYKRKVTKN